MLASEGVSGAQQDGYRMVRTQGKGFVVRGGIPGFVAADHGGAVCPDERPAAIGRTPESSGSEFSSDRSCSLFFCAERAGSPQTDGFSVDRREHQSGIENTARSPVFLLLRVLRTFVVSPPCLG